MPHTTTATIGHTPQYIPSIMDKFNAAEGGFQFRNPDGFIPSDEGIIISEQERKIEDQQKEIEQLKEQIKDHPSPDLH